MSLAYLDAFVASAQEAFLVTLGTTLSVADGDSPSATRAPCDVSGLIGLNGACRGTVVIGFSSATAMNIVHSMLGTRPTRLDAEVLDAVAEMTNIIAGGGKTRLKQLDVHLGLPMVICGASQAVQFPAIAASQQIHFDSSLGPVHLQVGLARNVTSPPRPSIPQEPHPLGVLPDTLQVPPAATVSR